MEQEILAGNPSSVVNYPEKSWTAYLKIGLFTLLLFIPIGIAIASSSYLWSGIYFLILFVIIAYYILLIKSINLYTDDIGIWVYSGILPWSKGVNGVKWRDLDGVSHKTGFGSWLFKSYTIIISHRFTKDLEIVLDHMAVGNKSTYAINDAHANMVKDKAIH